MSISIQLIIETLGRQEESAATVEEWATESPLADRAFRDRGRPIYGRGTLLPSRATN